MRGFNILLGLCLANIPMIRNIKYNYSDVVMKQVGKKANQHASRQTRQAGKEADSKQTDRQGKIRQIKNISRNMFPKSIYPNLELFDLILNKENDFVCLI